jgi:SAM-dependent methyltransferase
MNDYRNWIYEKYASNFKNGTLIFDEKDSLLWRKGYKWWFRNWLPVNNDAKILDVACGSGMLLHYFKDLGYTNIFGVDISPEQVALSKQVIENVTLDNALDYLEAYHNEYDLIVGLDIIEHFYKDEVMRFLDNCYSALKKNGRLIMQIPNAESPWGLSIRYGDFTHEVGFTPNCLRKILMLVGFTDIQGCECGPVPIRGVSIIRFLLWKILRLVLIAYNYIEAGNKGSGIYTRVFLSTGKKP